MAGDDSAQPLLPRQSNESERTRPSSGWGSPFSSTIRNAENVGARMRRALTSREQFYFGLAIIVLDVVALLANVFVKLIACEMRHEEEEWAKTTTYTLEVVGLVCSCLFMAELLACLLSFGPRYFSSWFRLFDGAVVVMSFAIDVASHGVVLSIGSFVVVLRLWRFVKLSEEIVMGASESMGSMRERLESLEKENKRLRLQLGLPEHPEGR